MSTPQDGLSNVIADVSFNIDGDVPALTLIDSFQVGPNGAVAGVGGVGIHRVSAGIVDVAIDLGKGCGPVVVAASLQVEISLATNGEDIDGAIPMSWTVTEKTAATASTPNIRIYTFHFFSHTLAPGPGGSVIAATDPVQCTITFRRKKELLPS